MKLKKLFCYSNIIRLPTAVLGIYICLRYSAECSQGIQNGLLFCIEVLVPSLFLFMALSSYIIKSGFAELLSKPAGGLTRFLFRLPPTAASAILLSAVGGYPVGAKIALMLYERGELSESEAQKTACIAVGAGPGFLLNYVGRALVGSAEAGTVLLASQVAGMLLTGFVAGRVIHTVPNPSRRRPKVHTSDNLLTESVESASKSVFQLCGMVVICSALTEVIAAVSPSDILTDLASAAVEITTGCSRMCGKYPLYLIASFIGFGGISVHLQIYAGMGVLKLNKGLFFLCRIIQGIFTAASAYILFMFFPVKQSVFNSTDLPLTFAKSATLAGSAALVLSSLCFLGSVHRLTEKAKK